MLSRFAGMALLPSVPFAYSFVFRLSRLSAIRRNMFSTAQTCPSPSEKGGVRLVMISDTHTMHSKLSSIPMGDILLHSGDFTFTGKLEEMKSFTDWLKQQPHTHKIFIAGNHDITAHTAYYADTGYKRFHDFVSNPMEYASMCRGELLKDGIVYLEDSGVSIVNGNSNSNDNNENVINIYGSPWQPEFYNWAFNLQRGDEIRSKWKLIPENTDILLTHGPPRNILDRLIEGPTEGCDDLREEIKERIKPRIHVFGHIHEGYGVYYDGTTLFINACSCTRRYSPINKPIVVDLPWNRSLPPRYVPESEWNNDHCNNNINNNE